MALVPNRPAALRKRITTYALVADVVIAFIVLLVSSFLVALIVFIIGLVLAGGLYYNFTQVMRNRGIRG
jgi:uncharacterized membrane protein